MAYSLGKQSLARLEGVDPRMVSVVKLAIKYSQQDFSVLCGVRTKAEQIALYAQGRTKPGNKVTWTLNSKHFPNPKTKLGEAVDLLTYPVDWNTTAKWDLMAAAMMRASRELKIPIKWGADWDMDGKAHEKGETDSGHFELV